MELRSRVIYDGASDANIQLSEKRADEMLKLAKERHFVSTVNKNKYIKLDF